MTTTAFRRAALSCALLASTTLTPYTPANAQTKLVSIPADKFAIAPGGVDMRTGRYVYKQTDLSIGGSDDGSGLALTRTMPDSTGNHANPFGSFSHNWDIMLVETRTDFFEGNWIGNDYRMNLHMGGRSFTFESEKNAVGFGYKSSGPRATLTSNGLAKDSPNVAYTLIGPDGTSMSFRRMGGEDCADQDWGTSTWGGGRRRCAFISEMVQPDGTRYYFDYAYDSARQGNRARLRQVTSSRGYALILEGSGNLVSKACAINLAQMVAPATGQCPQGAAVAATYGYAGGKLVGVTGPDGAASAFAYNPISSNSFEMAFTKPGQTTPWLTNLITMRFDEERASQETIDRQVFADGQSYTYAYDFTPVTTTKPEPTLIGGAAFDAAGRAHAVHYDFPILPGTGPTTPCTPPNCPERIPDDDAPEKGTYQQTPGPVTVEDPLGRVTSFEYCDPVALASLPPTQRDRCIVIPLRSFTDPEGLTTILGYDSFGNINKVTRKPKPGATLPDGSVPPDIVTSTAYDLTNPKSAAKPIWVKDANGNQTDYSYAPEHGGVLTETGPAVPTLQNDGTVVSVRPQKRYKYEQRYARIKNASGSHSPAASAVWLLTETSICKTGPASGNGCSIAGDELRTVYDYGPDSGPNNLLLRGVVEDAGGLNLRTCYAYDTTGNRIGETKPKGTAGLTGCP